MASIVTDINGDTVTDLNGRPVTIGVSYDDVVAGAVGHWSLQDDAASTAVAAIAGGTGTLQGGDTTSAITAAGPTSWLPKALALDGVADFVEHPEISITGEFSFSLWFKYESPSGYDGLAGPASGAAPKVLVQNNNGGEALIASINASNVIWDIPLPANDTDWHHLFFSRDANDLVRVWFDGVESPDGPQTVTGDFPFSAVGTRGASYLQGAIAGYVLVERNQDGVAANAIIAGPPPAVTASTLTFTGNTANFASTITDPNNGAVTTHYILQKLETLETVYEGTATSFEMPAQSEGPYQLWVIAENENGGAGNSAVSGVVHYDNSYESQVIEWGDPSLNSPWSIVDWGGFDSLQAQGDQLTVASNGDVWDIANNGSAILRDAPTGAFHIAVKLTDEFPGWARTLYVAESDAAGSPLLTITREAGTNEFGYVYRSATGQSATWTGNGNGQDLGNGWLEIAYDGVDELTVYIGGSLYATQTISWTPGKIGVASTKDGVNTANTTYGNFAFVTDQPRLYAGPVIPVPNPTLPASVKAYWNPSAMTSLGARVLDQSQNGNDLDYGAVQPTLETDSDGRKYLAFTQATTDFLTAQDFFDSATQDFAMIAVTKLKGRSTTNVGQIMGTTNARRVMRWSGDSSVALQEVEVGAALNGEIYAGSDIKQVTTVSHVSDLQRCRNFSVESSWGEPGRATAEQVADDVQATDADPSNPTGDLVINEAEHGLDFYGAIYLEDPTEQDIQDAIGWAMNQWALPGTVSNPAIIYQGDSTVHVDNAFPDRTPGWNRVLHETYLPSTIFGQNHANGGRRITRSAAIGAMDADDDRVYDTAIKHLVWSGRTVYWALMIGTNDAADGESAADIISEIEIEAARVAALGATPIWLGCCPDHQGDGPTGVRTLVSEGVRDNTNAFTQTIDALENDSVWGWGNEVNTTGPAFMEDNTHPNTAGNADIATKFATSFITLVGSSPSEAVSVVSRLARRLNQNTWRVVARSLWSN